MTTNAPDFRALLSSLADAAQGYLDAEEAHEEAVADGTAARSWGDSHIARAAALEMLEGVLVEVADALADSAPAADATEAQPS